MFAADEFRRFAEDNRPAEVNQLIGHIADDGIGSQARRRVGSAALDGHHDFRGVDFFPLAAGNLHNHPLSRIDTGLNGPRRAAQFLNPDDVDRLSAGPDFLYHPLVIRPFAAEADD